MNKKEKLMWFVGLFEGEGTFVFCYNYFKSICITSTDYDVLNRVRTNFGGKIYNLNKREIHWKNPFLWSLTSKKAYELCKKIYPYLLKRRKARCLESIKHFESRIKLKNKRKAFIEKIYKLSKTNLTQGRIAKKFNLDRTTINKILSNRNKNVKNNLY